MSNHIIATDDSIHLQIYDELQRKTLARVYALLLAYARQSQSVDADSANDEEDITLPSVSTGNAEESL